MWHVTASKSRLRRCAVEACPPHVLTGTEWVMFSSSSFNYSLCAPLTVGEMRHARCEMVCYWWGRTGYPVQSVREPTSAIRRYFWLFVHSCFFFFLLFSDSSQKVTFKLLLSESCSKPELNKQSVLRHMKLDLELMVVMLHSLSESANKQSTSLLQRGQVNKESATAGRHSSLGW